MAAPMIHLVCGSTGAGKTTYALALAERLGAIRFSIDEWMSTLFWMDSPDPIDGRWSMERVERCYRQIATTAGQLVTRGIPCVLDLGFTQAASRARFAALVRDMGTTAQLHWVDVPAAERWRRVEHRNGTRGPTEQLGFAVTRAMFDFVEALWEPPSAVEMAALDGIRVTADGG